MFYSILASKKNLPDSKLHIYDFMHEEQNNDSIFIEETLSEEIIKIVNECTT